METKVESLLSTDTEKSLRKKVKDLQLIIESQKVTEQILVAQLEKFKAQINAASAAIDTNAQQNKVAEYEGNINTKTLRDEENELLIQSLQDDVEELQAKLNKAESLVSTLSKNKACRAEMENLVRERQHFDKEKRDLRRNMSLMESSLIQSKEYRNELQVEMNRQREFFKAREDAILNGTRQLNEKVSGQERQIEKLQGALQYKKKKFIVRKSDDLNTIFVDEVERVMVPKAVPGSVHSIHSSRKAALSDIELVLTKGKLEKLQKKMNELEMMHKPLQSEILKLRKENQVLQSKLKKIRSSFEVKLALQKSQMMKQSLSEKLYRASHRKKQTLTPESMITVSVFEKRALISKTTSLATKTHISGTPEQKSLGNSSISVEKIKPSSETIKQRVVHNRMQKIDKNVKSLPFLNVSGYD